MSAQDPSALIASDAAIGVNRACVLGDRVFYLTDDAHLIALNRLTEPCCGGPRAGRRRPRLLRSTSAAGGGHLVLTGVSGGDNGIRGFVAAFQATTVVGVASVDVPKYGKPGPARHLEGYGSAGGRWSNLAQRQCDTEASVIYWQWAIRIRTPTG